MADKGTSYSLLNIRPRSMFEEGEYELVADGTDATVDSETDDEPEEYWDRDTLELYWYLCEKDE